VCLVYVCVGERWRMKREVVARHDISHTHFRSQRRHLLVEGDRGSKVFARNRLFLLSHRVMEGAGKSSEISLLVGCCHLHCLTILEWLLLLFAWTLGRAGNLIRVSLRADHLLTHTQVSAYRGEVRV